MGTDDLVKFRIKELYKAGIRKPKTIMYTLTQEINEPSIQQLFHFLNDLKIKLNGKTKSSYSDLAIWAEIRLSLPEDDHEVFVYGFEMKIDDLDPIKSYFRLVIGTKFLLKAAIYARHVCADTTHCMIWNGFPIFVAGTTDKGRHFHAFGLAICTTGDNQDFAFVFIVIKERVDAIYFIIYKPVALIPDAAGAITIAFTDVFGEDFIRIMCYCHMERACSRRLNGNDHEKAIILDLQSLQIAFSKPLFDLMIEKLRRKEKLNGYNIKNF